MSRKHRNDDYDGLSPMVLLQPQWREVAMKDDLFNPSTLGKNEEVPKDQENGAPLGEA